MSSRDIDTIADDWTIVYCLCRTAHLSSKLYSSNDVKTEEFTCWDKRFKCSENEINNVESVCTSCENIEETVRMSWKGSITSTVLKWNRCEQRVQFKCRYNGLNVVSMFQRSCKGLISLGHFKYYWNVQMSREGFKRLPLLLSTGWFQERIRSWCHNRTKVNWESYGRLT